MAAGTEPDTADQVRPAASTDESGAVFGLALGGGGARGLAHLGVLRVLERAALLPGVICGTSAGAVIGAAIASGATADDLIAVATETRWSEMVRPSIRRDRLVDPAPFEAFLESVIASADFDSLRIRFAAVAQDRTTKRRVILDDGDLLRSAAASAAVRKFLPPVVLDGRSLVDGTVVEPVPVGVTRELGAGYVVGVDVSPRAARPWSFRSTRPVPAGSVADLVVAPALGSRSAWDFTRVSEIIRLGEDAAERAIPKIRTDLERRRAL